MKSADKGKRSSRSGVRKDHGKALVRLTLAFVLIGLAVVYSSSAHISEAANGDDWYLLVRQAQKAVVGILLMILFSKIDYRNLRKLAKPLLWVSFFSLLVLLLLPEDSSLLGGVAGSDGEKVRRWYSLFGMSIQPSEFAKFAVILWGAHTVVTKASFLENFKKGVLPFLVVLGVIAFLVVVEPDLSQAFLISVTLLGILYLAGSRKAHLVPIVLVGILAFLLFCRMEPYRWERLMSHIDDSGSSEGINYQSEQSLIAVGSGGLVGVGWGAGRQKLRFLPEAHKDFIFSIIGEEFGLLGALLIITGYGYFCYLGLNIARSAKDRFGYYLSSGIVVMIVLGAILNMMVVVVLIPSTGLPLPFISYGGSSLVVSLVSVGVLRSVAKVSAGNLRMKAVR